MHYLKFQQTVPEVSRVFIIVLIIEQGLVWINMKNYRENSTNILCDPWKYWILRDEFENVGLSSVLDQHHSASDLTWPSILQAASTLPPLYASCSFIILFWCIEFNLMVSKYFLESSMDKEETSLLVVLLLHLCLAYRTLLLPSTSFTTLHPLLCGSTLGNGKWLDRKFHPFCLSCSAEVAKS